MGPELPVATPARRLALFGFTCRSEECPTGTNCVSCREPPGLALLIIARTLPFWGFLTAFLSTILVTGPVFRLTALSDSGNEKESGSLVCALDVSVLSR